MKKLLFLLAVLLTLTVADAQQVSKQEAFAKAQQFFSKASRTQMGKGMAPRKAPVLTLANNRDEFYVFNDEANGGYVVISGEERMPDVLTYSRDCRFDVDDLPCNMQAWLEDYAEQVKYLRAHPEAKATKRTSPERENVGPLLTCRFSQGKPYNNKCPEVNGQRCPTGCVATATAQIMHYWQWPKQTTDVIPGYTTSTYNIDMPAQPITTIDWDNILSDYHYWEENYNETQADAISTLMLLCGTAFHMDYIPGGSGADPFNASYVLSQLFCYDYSIGGIYRENYKTDEWEQIIFEELNEGRPLLYGAWSNIGGHTFVLDGYENGYFHVNWGWGGSESWVLMTGEEGWQGFTMEHRAVIGIQPAPVGIRYGVFDNGTMTLYYDNEMASRPGIVLKMEELSDYEKQVSKCVIDPSFANISMRILKDFFSGWSKLESIEGIENLNTSKTVDMGLLFCGCSKLKSLDCSSFKTDNVENMSWMFDGCSGLTSLDVSGFKTDKVKYMQSMFSNCRSLTSLDVSGFKTDNVTDMSQMFNNCHSLTSLDVSGFKTDKVTSMPAMFYSCRSLTNLDVSGFKTDNVTNMGSMFSSCRGLTSLDVSGFKTDNVTDMSSMFYGCRGLTSLDVSNFNTENVKNMNNMFCDIPTLHTIYCNDSWSCDSSADMFKGCTSLVGAISYDDSKTDVIYANPTTGYFTPKSLNLGDVTGDGEVTVADAVSVVNIILSSGHTGVKGK